MAAETFLWIAFLCVYSAFALLRGYYAWRKRFAGAPAKGGATHGDPLVWRVLLIGGFLAQAVCVTLYGYHHHLGQFDWFGAWTLPLPAIARWAGFAGALISLAGLGWVHATLGKFFSEQLAMQDDHRLVTGGPYAKVRHPMYTCLVGFFLFSALLAGHGLIVLASVQLSTLLLLRIPREERMLRETFGADYEAYAKGTGRVLPRL